MRHSNRRMCPPLSPLDCSVCSRAFSSVTFRHQVYTTERTTIIVNEHETGKNQVGMMFNSQKNYKSFLVKK